MKLIHVKSKTSVALPIYTSDLDNVKVLEDAEEEAQAQISKKKRAKAKKQAKKNKKTEDGKQTNATGEGEEIPQLVPIGTPSKKPKLETPSKKKQLQKSRKPSGAKKGRNAPNKMTKKAGKTGKRRAPKVK